ncbi:MAG: complex I subunit 4 family protein [Anaerolineae bacterium]|jgi:NADH-quinone oxidoreductase subunit M
MGFPILSLVTFLPLLGALMVLLLPAENTRAIKQVSVGTAVVGLGLGTIIWSAYDRATGGLQFVELARWIPGIDVNYYMGVDGISVPLIFLTTLLTPLALLYSAYTIKVRVKEFFLLFLVLETGMLGVFCALDLVLFYVFWELGLVPMYFLIGLWGGERREYAAIKFFLYTLAGSVAMLLGLLYLYFTTGSFSIPEVAATFETVRPFASNMGLVSLVFWAVFIAFAIKLPLWPFHTWLPDAHTEAPTAGSVILAGVLLKLGGYGFVRILLPIFPSAFKYWAPLIAALAVASIVYGALVCMAQWDLKRLIAYSSVSHMGYVMLGLAAGAAGLGVAGQETAVAIAFNGAAMQMFNHGIITGALFLLVGVIYERAHTRDLRAFGGLGSVLPYFFGFMLVAGFASLGLPGLAGFWAELFVFRGALAIIPVFAIIGGLGIVFTAVYILWKVMQHLFFGKLDERWRSLPDMYGWEVVSLAPLVAFMFFFGFYPTPLVELINTATTALANLL